ncbi:MAG: thioredoxin family protein [Porticoccaceae bacterium]
MKFLSKIIVTALFIIPFSVANALEKESFTQERFDELTANGEVVLVDIFATWCPTCAKQREVLEAYQAANPNSELHILEVDFDDQKDVVRQFRAPRQSTLYLYKGEEQVWFSVAETSADIITGEIAKALGSGTE